MDRQPIRITRQTHGVGVPDNWTIGIVFGETEKSIEEELIREGVITEKTKYQEHPSL